MSLGVGVSLGALTQPDAAPVPGTRGAGEGGGNGQRQAGPGYTQESGTRPLNQNSEVSRLFALVGVRSWWPSGGPRWPRKAHGCLWETSRGLRSARRLRSPGGPNKTTLNTFFSVDENSTTYATRSGSVRGRLNEAGSLGPVSTLPGIGLGTKRLNERKVKNTF